WITTPVGSTEDRLYSATAIRLSFMSLIISIAPADRLKSTPLSREKVLGLVLSSGTIGWSPTDGIFSACRIGSMIVPYVDLLATTAATLSCCAVRAHCAATFGLNWSLQEIIFTGCPLMPPLALIAIAAAWAPATSSGEFASGPLPT